MFQEKIHVFPFSLLFQRQLTLNKPVNTNSSKLKNTTFIHENLLRNTIEPVINGKFKVAKVQYNHCKSNNYYLHSCLVHLGHICCQICQLRFQSCKTKTRYSTENKNFIPPFMRPFWIIPFQRAFVFEWYNLLGYSKSFFNWKQP